MAAEYVAHHSTRVQTTKHRHVTGGDPTSEGRGIDRVEDQHAHEHEDGRRDRRISPEHAEKPHCPSFPRIGAHVHRGGTTRGCSARTRRFARLTGLTRPHPIVCGQQSSEEPRMSAQIVDVDNFTRVETDTMIDRMLPIIGGVGCVPPRPCAPAPRPATGDSTEPRHALFGRDHRSQWGPRHAHTAGGRRPVRLGHDHQPGHYITVSSIGQAPIPSRSRSSRPRTSSLRRASSSTGKSERPRSGECDPGSDHSHRERHSGVLSPRIDHDSYVEVREALLVLGKTMGGLSDASERRKTSTPCVTWSARRSAGVAFPMRRRRTSTSTPASRRPLHHDLPRRAADAFWSVSVYNAAGYFEPGPIGATNVNSVFATKNEDGSTTVRLGDHGNDAANSIPLPEGWNLLIRLYRRGSVSSPHGRCRRSSPADHTPAVQTSPSSSIRKALVAPA